ncbi:MAG: DOMON-like domain-containing protein [Steroidobacteraceae bacterium]
MPALQADWLDLHPHPSGQGGNMRRVTAMARAREDGGLTLAYRLEWSAGFLRLPVVPASGRHNTLWHHTCLEAFLQAPGQPGYHEFNFSPAGAWAAYRFSGFRQDMEDLPLSLPPTLRIDQGQEHLYMECQLPRDALPNEAPRIGLTAILEDRDGGLHFWALHHPAPRPEFHDQNGFVLQLSRQAGVS